jgi:hypothetical protein
VKEEINEVIKGVEKVDINMEVREEMGRGDKKEE